MSASLTYLAAASIGASALAMGSHLSGDAGALAVYGIGALQGALFAALVASRLYVRTKSSAETATAQAANEEAMPASTPRSLLKSVSAVEKNALVPASASAAPQSAHTTRANTNTNALLSVEYTLEEYETLRKQQRAEAGSTKRGSKSTPDSGARSSS